jgi:hypothetical protein
MTPFWLHKWPRTTKYEPCSVGITVYGCYLMPMDSISMRPNTIQMSKRDLGSSLSWLSASTMMLWHQFDSTSDPVLVSHQTNHETAMIFHHNWWYGWNFPTKFDMWGCKLTINMISSLCIVSGTIQVWLYGGVSKSLPYRPGFKNHWGLRTRHYI